MKRRARRSAWTIALFSSLGIHGVLAASLAMLPMPDARRPETRVDVQILPEGRMDAVAASAEAAIPADPELLLAAAGGGESAQAGQPAHPDALPLPAPDAATLMRHEPGTEETASIAMAAVTVEATEPDRTASEPADIPDAAQAVNEAATPQAPAGEAMLVAAADPASDQPAPGPAAPRDAAVSPASEATLAVRAESPSAMAARAESATVAGDPPPIPPDIAPAASEPAGALAGITVSQAATASIAASAPAASANPAQHDAARPVVASAVLPLQVGPGEIAATGARDPAQPPAIASPAASMPAAVPNAVSSPNLALAAAPPPAAASSPSTPSAPYMTPANNSGSSQPSNTIAPIANSVATVAGSIAQPAVPGAAAHSSPGILADTPRPSPSPATSSVEPLAVGAAAIAHDSAAGSVATSPAVLPANGLGAPARGGVEIAPVEMTGVATAAVPTTGAAIPIPNAGIPPEIDEVAILLPLLPLSPEAPAREQNARERIIEHLSTLEGGNCFLAMPEEDADAVVVTSFSAASGRLFRLGDEISRATGVPVAAQTHTVTSDQCGALSLARSLSPSGVPAIGIHPDVQAIASGDVLSGGFAKPRLPFTTLLLVDHAGTVQRFRNLAEGGGGMIRFDTPMTRMGGAVATPQLLVAIATDKELDTFAAYDGMHADRYFSALADEIAERNVTVEFGVTHFFMQ